MQLEWKKEWMIPVGVGIGSFIAGAAAGYIYKTYRVRYLHEVLNEELQELESQNDKLQEEINSKDVQLEFKFDEEKREFKHMIQQASHVVDELAGEGKSRLEKHAENMHAAAEAESEAHYQRYIEKARLARERGEPEPIWSSVDDDWDYTEELKTRTPNAPYIIHRDEFFEDPDEYRQSTITYYSGDCVLTDTDDVPIYNAQAIVGLLIFGKGSGDPNVVYVRNEELDAEYEVLHDPGFFSVAILGAEMGEDAVDPDFKHCIHRFKDA